jgi:hypothetical protein
LSGVVCQGDGRVSIAAQRGAGRAEEPSHVVDLAGASWRKSSFSGGPSQNCVEVAELEGGRTAVRDSKDPSGPALVFTPAEWAAFVQGVRADEFG